MRLVLKIEMAAGRDGLSNLAFVADFGQHHRSRRDDLPPASRFCGSQMFADKPTAACHGGCGARSRYVGSPLARG